MLEAALQLRFFDFGEEAEASEVHPEDRDVVRHGESRAREEGAVSTERDDEVGVVDRRRTVVAVNLDRLRLAGPCHGQGPVDHRLLRSRSPQEADLHVCSGKRWKKISRLPCAPVTSDAASALTV